MTTSILLASGRLFDPFAPQGPYDIGREIAPALSKICRFTGHVSDFYSVAQHSILVSELCDREHALAGLLHDASEAYLADIAAPLKRHPAFGAYLAVEHRVQADIMQAHGLAAELPQTVLDADLLALAMEARDLMPPGIVLPVNPGWTKPIVPWAPNVAEALFVARYNQLRGIVHHVE